MTRSRSMVRMRVCVYSLSFFFSNLWEKRTILPNFSLVCSSSSCCSHRSIEPAAVKFFTFCFCDENDDDVNDDLTVRANVYRVLLRGRMINWFSLDMLFLCLVTDSLLSLSLLLYLKSRAMRKRKMRGILLRKE